MSAHELDVFWTNEDLHLPGGGMLNPDLVKQQNLTLMDIRRIVALHGEKDRVMRECHERIKQIEFQMQDAWGFGRDETRHTHRFNVPNPELQPIDGELNDE